MVNGHIHIPWTKRPDFGVDRPNLTSGATRDETTCTFSDWYGFLQQSEVAQNAEYHNYRFVYPAWRLYLADVTSVERRMKEGMKE